MNLADKLLKRIDMMENPCCVGLDPDIRKIPAEIIRGDNFENISRTFLEFNKRIVDSVFDLVPCVKPQIAFWEKYGSIGVAAFKEIVDYAHAHGLIVIEDGKRNDIANTAQQYADGHLGVVQTRSDKRPSLDLDLLTVNPYLGDDGLRPFVDVCKEHGKGIFILAKTSNPSSGDLQDRLIEITEDEQREFENIGIRVEQDRTQLYNLVALNIRRYAQECVGERGYSPIGAVVGATFPEQADVLRKIMHNSIFLVPGYGTQGAKGKDVVPCFNTDGYGAVVNAASSITYAYLKHGGEAKKDYAEAARDATIAMIKDVKTAMIDGSRFPQKWSRNF